MAAKKFSNTVAKNMCLTCLLESRKKLYPINGADDANLAFMIEECGGIQIPQRTDYPDKICSKCYKLVKSAYDFRLSCQRSEQELRLRLNGEVKNESEDFDFENVTLMDVESVDLNDTIQQLKETNCLLEEEDIFNLPCPSIENLEKERQTKRISKVLEKKKNNIVESVKYRKQKRQKTKKPPEMLETNLKTGEDCNNGKLASGVNEVIEAKEIDLYICHLCGNKYPNKQKLHAHLKHHKSKVEREYECEICMKRFMTARHLQIHMNTHTGNRPYKCKYCGAAFGDPSSRIKHERAHDNIRAYKCGICEKSFIYSYGLTKHQRIHTGEKPFACSYCEKRFVQKHHQKAHELTHVKNMTSEVREFVQIPAV